MLRIVSLPPFRAAVSEPDPKGDFSPDSALGRFDQYFSALRPSPRDSFMPRDFLYFDERQGGMVWMYALAEGLSDGGFPTADFPGGLYATYVWRDGYEAENARLYRRTLEEIEATSTLAPDDTRPAMGHIITPPEVQRVLGYAQMETFLPIRVKK